MKPLLLALCLFASPVWAQTQTPEERSPTVRERVDTGLMIGSISMSSIALGLTMSCTSAGTCWELNPIMDKFLNDGPVEAVVFKSAVNGALHYAVWRTTKGKTRTILLAALFAVNTFDAVHDMRVIRRIESRQR